MYCPRCLKSVPDENVEEIAKRLSSTMGNNLLSEGKCPVCGTRLISEGGARAAGVKQGE